MAVQANLHWVIETMILTNTRVILSVKNKIAYRRQQLVIIQKNIRMYNARKKYRPRYLGVLKIKGIQVCCPILVLTYDSQTVPLLPVSLLSGT